MCPTSEKICLQHAFFVYLFLCRQAVQSNFDQPLTIALHV
jgi:hypothetical protein